MSTTYGPYSSAKEANGLLFIAGQVGIDPKTKIASEDFNKQAVQVLENLSAVLAENNLSLKDVVNVRIYLTNILNFEAMNTVYKKYFDGIAPSRECVGVADLPHVAGDVPLLIEISAIAGRGDE